MFDDEDDACEYENALAYDELDPADEELDPAAYTDNLLVLPHDWPTPAFEFGEHARPAECAREQMITGMKLDLIDETGATPAATWMYLLAGRWYQEHELVAPEPAVTQEAAPASDDFDPFLDVDDLP